MASQTLFWYTVTVEVPAKAGGLDTYVIHAAEPPKVGSSWGGGIVRETHKYDTEDEAKKAQSKALKPNDPFPGFPNPLSGIDRIGAVVEAFFRAVTDVKFWRSLGWILLGIIMLVVGIRIWMGKPLLPQAPVPVPV